MQEVSAWESEVEECDEGDLWRVVARGIIDDEMQEDN